MSVVAKKDAKKKAWLERERKTWLESVLKLRPSQTKRVLELIDLWQHSTDEQEKLEIKEAFEEICFPCPEDLIATPIDAEKSKDGGKALTKHREYVGGQIKKRRHKLRMTQEELATKAGIPQSHVCRLETGKHAPTYLTIEKVANALSVTPSQLDPGFDD